jgi:hypothetical protein
MNIFLSIFNLLQFIYYRKKLNYNKYSEQKINMRHFIQANEYDMDMYTKIQHMNMHEFL